MTLADAMAAARAGRREEARELLMRVLETDERNVQAWLWLSGVVDDPEDMRVCLSNVLHLEPNNAHALKGMAILEQKHGKPHARAVGAAPAPAAPAPAAPAPAAPASASTDSVMDILSRYGPSPVFAPAEAAAPAPAAPAPAAPAPVASSSDGFSPTPLVRPGSDVGILSAPCPYCGEPALMSVSRCPACHRSMKMFIPADPNTGSRSLTLLALFWSLPLIIFIAGFISLVLFNLVTGLSKGTITGGDVIGSIISSIIFIGIVLVFHIPAMVFWRGLYQKRRWAYIIALIRGIITGLTFVGLAIFFLLGGSFIRDNADSAPFLIDVVLLFISFVLYGIVLIPFIVMLVKGYGDVYGSYKRVAYAVADTDSGTHYNNGVLFKNQGMWYAAMLEWEAAVYTSPQDTHYLHALALAQAQLKQRDKALATMKHAMALEPSNAGLQETFRLMQQGHI